jgi:hypothetical protein
MTEGGESSLLDARPLLRPRLRQLLKPKTCFILEDTGFRRCLRAMRSEQRVNHFVPRWDLDAIYRRSRLKQRRDRHR